jgi:hypothetical protein
MDKDHKSAMDVAKDFGVTAQDIKELCDIMAKENIAQYLKTNKIDPLKTLNALHQAGLANESYFKTFIVLSFRRLQEVIENHYQQNIKSESKTSSNIN